MRDTKFTLRVLQTPVTSAPAAAAICTARWPTPPDGADDQDALGRTGHRQAATIAQALERRHARERQRRRRSRSSCPPASRSSAPRRRPRTRPRPPAWRCARAPAIPGAKPVDARPRPRPPRRRDRNRGCTETSPACRDEWRRSPSSNRPGSRCSRRPAPAPARAPATAAARSRASSRSGPPYFRYTIARIVSLIGDVRRRALSNGEPVLALGIAGLAARNEVPLVDLPPRMTGTR